MSGGDRLTEPERPVVAEQLSVIGERIRQARLAQGLSSRAFAKVLGVSPSLVSQVELGKALPSVSTFFAMANKLGLPLDEVFLDQLDGARSAVEGSTPFPRPPTSTPHPDGNGVVMRRPDRPSISLATGVRCDRLTPGHKYEFDFLNVTYDVGSESCPTDALLTHSGREYGLVLEGCLGVTLGFSSYELYPGDSIAMEAAVPHRIWTIGPEPAVVVWVIIGRGGDARF